MKKSQQNWQKFVSQRFLTKKNTLTGSQVIGFSFIGLTLGGITLIIVLSIMNGFQRQFQDSLKEINSFHARIQQTIPSLNERPKIPANVNITHLFPFSETQVLAQNSLDQAEPALVKGLLPSLINNDLSFKNLLILKEGSWTFEEPKSLLIGERLAYSLGLQVGDPLKLISLASPKNEKNLLTLKEDTFKVSGIWKSSYYPLSRYGIFINLHTSLKNLTSEESILWGIKVKKDQDLAKLIQIDSPDIKVSLWTDQNKSFLGALEFEKTSMTFLLSLIFIIVGLNTYYSIRQRILKYKEEIAILKSLGSSSSDIIRIFAREGFLLAFLGGTISITLGITLTIYLNEILKGLEIILNKTLYLIEIILNKDLPYFSLKGSVEGNDEGWPMIIYWSDIVFIYSFIYLSTIIGSWMAISPLSQKKPLSLIKNE